jgi:hypothetical protein
MKRVLLIAIGLVALARGAAAEPAFLSRQYTRCTTCHFSPTGGGLLTPYGRSLARNELSTTGARHASDTTAPPTGFVDSLLDNRIGPVSIGGDFRPAHLDVSFPGGSLERDFLMTADIIAAYHAKDWTVYGEFGRQPRTSGTKYDSYEYWAGRQPAKGIGFRAGRFLPAYGVRYADHTAFTRAALGIDSYDQVLGVEISRAGDRSLVQLTAAPGRAESIYDDDGSSAFIGAARLQRDFGSRTVLVLSGMYRASSDVTAQNTMGGVSFGFAPVPRLTTWTEVHARKHEGASGAPLYVFLNETSFEVYRGIWLKFSPQLLTEAGNTSGGTLRLMFEADLLPRARWNVDVSYYHDEGRESDIVSHTLLAQLHVYP